MRIVIDARLYGLRHRGIGRYVMQLINGLANLPASHEYWLLIDPSSGYTFDHLPANFKTVPSPWRVYSLAEQIHLPPLLWRLKPRLVHWTHFSAPFFCSCPYLVTIHDLILHHLPSERASQLPAIVYWLKVLAYRLLLAKLLKGAKAVITVSQTVAADVWSFYGKKNVKVIPLGISHLVAKSKPRQFEEFNRQASPLYFLIVGAVYPHKNIERTVKAFARAGFAQSGYQLLIAGREDYFTGRLRQWLKEQGYDRFVDFRGEVSETELCALYMGAQAYLLPSLYEGFGLCALEAISLGTPVLAADIPVLREVLGSAAIYANPLSEYELAKAMKAIIQPECRQHLREQGRQIIKKYDWSFTAKQTLDLYNQLIAD